MYAFGEYLLGHQEAGQKLCAYAALVDTAESFAKVVIPRDTPIGSV